MTRQNRYDAFITHFSSSFPEPKTELNYQSPFELLVSVVLSAQCTDERVNKVTPKLFEHFPSPQLMAMAHFDELFPFIKSISYPSNKTKHLIALSKKMVEEFNSKIPNTMKDLISLQGVGRKTANVILSVLYNQPAMAVDTHVFRVSKRLGLVAKQLKTPLEVEKTLVKYIPKNYIARAHHWLILHGRYVCVARKPKCSECDLSNFCKFYEQIAS